MSCITFQASATKTVVAVGSKIFAFEANSGNSSNNTLSIAELGVFNQHEDSCNDISLNEGNTLAVTCSRDGTARVFDVATLLQLSKVGDDSYTGYAAAFLGGNYRDIAVAAFDSAHLIFFNARTGEQIGKTFMNEDESDEINNIIVDSKNNNNQRLIVSTTTGKIIVLALEVDESQQQQQKQLTGVKVSHSWVAVEDGTEICGIALNPVAGDKVAVVADDDSYIRVFNVSDGTEACEKMIIFKATGGGGDNGRSITWRDDTTVVVGFAEGEISTYKLEGGKLNRVDGAAFLANTEENSIITVAVSPGNDAGAGKLIAAGGSSEFVRIFDSATGTKLAEHRFGDNVNRIRWIGNNTLAVACRDNTARILLLASGKPINSTPMQCSAPVAAIVPHSTAPTLLATAQLTDAAKTTVAVPLIPVPPKLSAITDTLELSVDNVTQTVSAYKFSKNAAKETIRALSTATRCEVGGFVQYMSINNDKTFLSVWSNSGIFKTYSLADNAGALVQEFKPPKYGGCNLSFSPAIRDVFFVLNYPGFAYACNAVSGQVGTPVNLLASENDKLSHLQWASDGRSLVAIDSKFNLITLKIHTHNLSFEKVESGSLSLTGGDIGGDPPSFLLQVSMTKLLVGSKKGTIFTVNRDPVTLALSVAAKTENIAGGISHAALINSDTSSGKILLAAITGDGKQVSILDATDGNAVTKVGAVEQPSSSSFNGNCIDVSPDGRVIAVGDAGTGTVNFFGANTAEANNTTTFAFCGSCDDLHGDRAVLTVRFVSRRLLASTGKNGGVVLTVVDRGEVLFVGAKLPEPLTEVVIACAAHDEVAAGAKGVTGATLAIDLKSGAVNNQ